MKIYLTKDVAGNYGSLSNICTENLVVYKHTHKSIIRFSMRSPDICLYADGFIYDLISECTCAGEATSIFWSAVLDWLRSNLGEIENLFRLHYSRGVEAGRKDIQDDIKCILGVS